MAGKVNTDSHFAINKAGQAVSQTDEQAAEAAANGYKPISGDAYREARKAEHAADYVDQNWGAGGKIAAGLASGATLGLAPALATKFGLLDREHLEAAQETGLFQAGDVAGMVAPTLLSGGESLIAKGLARGGAGGAGRVAAGLMPAGLMAEAGGVAERLAGRFLPEAGLLGKAAGTSLKMAARGATEGAIVNLSHEVSENVIQNKPLAAQSLAASAIEGALFGGLTGGILGGIGAAVGSGIDVASGRVAGMGAGTGEVAAAKALKFMGASDAKLAELAARDGTLQSTLKGFHGVIEGSDVGQGVSHIAKVAKASEAGYRATAEDAIQTLQKNHPLPGGRLSAITERIGQDLTTAYGGQLEYNTVKQLYRGISRDLQGVKTWEGYAASREQLADRMHSYGPGLRQDVYKHALSAYDSEFRVAMEQADKELATTYLNAVTGQRQAQEISDLVAKKSVAPAKSPIHMDNSDAATIGFAAVTGADPVVGAGVLAAKKLALYAASKMEAPMAEAAYRAAIGAQAGQATVNVGSRISAGLKSFISGGRVAALDGQAKASKPSYTMKSYENTMAMADNLTSMAHQAKVREQMDALSQMGHPELAKEIALTYGRAVAYINHNKKNMRSKEKEFGSIGRPAKHMGLSTQDMRSIRQIHGIAKPLDAILGGLARGDISRDAVDAVRYVYPDVHADIVYRASQEIMALKAEGKFMPEDRIAMLGTALNAPVDSRLMPEFIAEVQMGLAANKATPPENGDVPPPITDTSSYQTPLQASV